MQAKLTKRKVDATAPLKHGQLLVWDTEIKGFGLRVYPTSKTYIVQKRVQGRTVRVTIGAHGVFTPEQAREEARKLLGDLSKHIDVNRAKREAAQAARRERVKSVTLEEACIAYKQNKTRAQNTVRDYEKAMRLGFSDWKDKPVREITRVMVERRFEKLSATSKAQANQMFRFLRALINFAKEKYADENGEPLLPSNPCDRLKTLKLWHRIERRTRYIQPEKLRDWFAALSHTPTDTPHRKTIKNFCVFVLLTGTREQEAAKVEWSDVDFRARTVTFRQTKNRKTHVLPIGRHLIAMLERRKATTTSRYVFPSEDGIKHLKNHRKGVLEIADKSGVDFRLHDLRRTFSSIVNHQLERSLSQYTVKRLLNHSDSDVTGGYIQFGVEDLREPMQLIESFVLRHAGIEGTAAVVTIPNKRVRGNRPTNSAA